MTHPPELDWKLETCLWCFSGRLCVDAMFASCHCWELLSACTHALISTTAADIGSEVLFSFAFTENLNCDHSTDSAVHALMISIWRWLHSIVDGWHSTVMWCDNYLDKFEAFQILLCAEMGNLRWRINQHLYKCCKEQSSEEVVCLHKNNSINFSQYSYQFIHLVRWWYHISENSERYVMSYYGYEAFTLTTTWDECVNAINWRRRLCSFVTIRCYSWTCRVRKLGKSQIFYDAYGSRVSHKHFSCDECASRRLVHVPLKLAIIS